VRLLGLEASIRIEVWDSAPNPPLLHDETGSPVKRGCYPAARGKVVWAELLVLPVLPGRTPSHQPISADEGEGTQPDHDLLCRVRGGLDEL